MSVGCATTPAATPTRPQPPVVASVPNACGGCQTAMGNTCIKVVGAAVDRPGVTVARLCEPWCCQVTASEWGDVGYAPYARAEPWSTCPVDAVAKSGAGALAGWVSEGAEYHVERATVVVTGGGQTVADVSGDDGGFRFDGLAPGNYTLAVYYGDVVYKKQCIVVDANASVTFHVDLDVDVVGNDYLIVE